MSPSTFGARSEARNEVTLVRTAWQSTAGNRNDDPTAVAGFETASSWTHLWFLRVELQVARVHSGLHRSAFHLK
ncbi:hypothetical protein CH063_15261 [Colletotrichum higginsianum]|uniref:Uncharacterized protein n=1 Tax=Colletotrichum higginsianum (strain IMI 349063) TaxID=759273 RepID=H1W232_COLHI|nr:hypothetical protein CH063_15261 [Colletotrichum higginsianum]